MLYVYNIYNVTCNYIAIKQGKSFYYTCFITHLSIYPHINTFLILSEVNWGSVSCILIQSSFIYMKHLLRSFCAIHRFIWTRRVTLYLFLLYNIVFVLPYIDMNLLRVYLCSPSWIPFPTSIPSHPIPLGHASAPALSNLSHAYNQDWQSVSHMIIYTFQCYSLRSSHPHHLPQSPKNCSIHLCLFCCLAYRVVVTIFLNSVYMC